MRAIVVMPAYDEAGTIREVARRVLAQPVDRLLVVDDGSTDGTTAALAGLEVEVLTNPTNQGKGASLLRGLRHAQALGGDVVLTLDADGQHRPEDIPRLLATAARYPERIIIGARTLGREKAPAARRRANAFADFWISWACAQPVRDSQSGFRLYPAALLERLRTTARPGIGFVFESEILIDAAALGVGSLSIPIETLYATSPRPSHYRPVTDTTRIVLMIAGKLARRGFSPRALWRSLRARPGTGLCDMGDTS